VLSIRQAVVGNQPSLVRQMRDAGVVDVNAFTSQGATALMAAIGAPNGEGN